MRQGLHNVRRKIKKFEILLKTDLEVFGGKGIGLINAKYF